MENHFYVLLQMNLIAKLNHPYIVEFKDAWVDKVSVELAFIDRIADHRHIMFYQIKMIAAEYWSCWSLNV